MTTDELNAIVKAVMTEMEKAGVDFDFKAETPQANDLVYVMRGTADKYQGITVKWQNLLDIIVQKATEARDDAISAKDIALETLATIRGIESNVSSMKSSVDASEANVTQMKSDVSEMKTSVEGTKTEVEGLKSDVTILKSQTQTIVDNAKNDVEGLLDTKVNYTDSLSYEEIMATTDLTGKVSSASVIKDEFCVDVTNRFTVNSTYFNNNRLQAFRFGKIIFISAHLRAISDVPNATIVLSTDFTLNPLNYMLYATIDAVGYTTIALQLGSNNIAISSYNLPKQNQILVINEYLIIP